VLGGMSRQINMADLNCKAEVNVGVLRKPVVLGGGGGYELAAFKEGDLLIQN
jgi:hypothetical protein